ncbi:MAG: response regulator, partial [Rhodospirillaceae bacterium]|nr:response regulator [Rhodospirillaceae bacterium]
MNAMGAASLHGTGTIPADPLRVMVVDDSAVVRGLLTRLLEADGGISVVASVADGRAALAAATRTDPEVVVLDADTPATDGLAALARLIAARPDLQVLVSSALTRQGAETGLKALAAGASDWIARPGARIMAAETFRSELLDKVRSLGWAARRRGRARAGGPAAAPAPTAAARAAARPA